MFDVGDPLRNVLLNLCFVSIALLTTAAILPWRFLGAARLDRLARWVIVPVLLLAVAYEAIMPARFDIRVDLLLLLPMYGLVVVSSIVRWWHASGTRKKPPRGRKE
jgi:hypothetical protein